MTVCEDGPVVAQATEKDSQVTLGAFLRRTSPDELPQIATCSRADEFCGSDLQRSLYNEVPQADQRLHDSSRVRPGITGWAQVNQTARKHRPSTRCSGESSTTWTTSRIGRYGWM